MDLNLDDFVVARRPFNSPMEMGLRAVILLNSLSPRRVDLQRLIYLDYLLVHSGDVADGPASLHPPIPHRAGEWIIKRKRLLAGLNLMFSKELVGKALSNEGVVYYGNELSQLFAERLSAPYAERLKTVAAWVVETFVDMNDIDLSQFMHANMDKWGAEFGFESVLRGLPQ
jgi:hypothetical protein